MTIYEIMFYGDSIYDTPCICKIEDDIVCKKLITAMYYENCEVIKIKNIQNGTKDNFVKNTQKLLIVDEKVKYTFITKCLDDIQFISTEIEGEKYYIINILKMINESLNLEKSLVTTFPKDFPNKQVQGKIGSIWKTVLFKEKIEGHIFRISEFPSNIYVDDYFKGIVEEYRFTGIDFQKVELS